jgi:hypothetical protein
MTSRKHDRILEANQTYILMVWVWKGHAPDKHCILFLHYFSKPEGTFPSCHKSSDDSPFPFYQSDASNIFYSTSIDFREHENIHLQRGSWPQQMYKIYHAA